ncbi:MAG TPA: AI-2E family transporter [Candidatus Paceibacterota bacterium]
MNTDLVQKYFFAGLFLLVTALIFFIFLPFLEVLVLSVIFAVLLTPLYERVSKDMYGKKGPAAFLVILLFTLVIIAPLVLLGGLILDEARDVYTNLSSQNQADYVQKLTGIIEGPIKSFYPTFSLNLGEIASAGADWLVGHLTAVLSKVFSIATGLILMLISLYFFLRDGAKFKKILVKLSPLNDKYDEQIFAKIKLTISATMKGVLLVAIIQGVLACIGMLIFGVPNAILWGSISAIASLVPGLGTAIVFIPAVAYMFILGNTAFAIGLIVWGVVVVGLVDNFLTPYLYSREIEVHPLITLFAVLGGLIVFGPIGFIFGPLVVALFFSLIEIYQGIISKNKNL